MQRVGAARCGHATWQPCSPAALHGAAAPTRARCPCAESQPCGACLQVVCLWHAMRFLSSRFRLRERNVSQRVAAAFKAKTEPANDLQKLLNGRDCLQCQDASCHSGQHGAALGHAPILRQVRSCTDTGSRHSALYRRAAQAPLQNPLRLWHSPCGTSMSPRRVGSSPHPTGSVAGSILHTLRSPDVTSRPPRRAGRGGQGRREHRGDVRNAAGAVHSWGIRAQVMLGTRLPAWLTRVPAAGLRTLQRHICNAWCVWGPPSLCCTSSA